MKDIAALLIGVAVFAFASQTNSEAEPTPCPGYAHASSVIETHVNGSFTGCDFDKFIPL
jgi:hypothetical protein